MSKEKRKKEEVIKEIRESKRRFWTTSKEIQSDTKIIYVDHDKIFAVWMTVSRDTSLFELNMD